MNPLDLPSEDRGAFARRYEEPPAEAADYDELQFEQEPSDLRWLIKWAAAASVVAAIIAWKTLPQRPNPASPTESAQSSYVAK